MENSEKEILVIYAIFGVHMFPLLIHQPLLYHLMNTLDTQVQWLEILLRIVKAPNTNFIRILVILLVLLVFIPSNK
jgi:hypothetical protein